jgi:peroxiredoxin Q/BCP
MMGKTYWGIARTTVIIDERGKVAKVFANVKVQGHSAEVLAALRQMA